MEEDIQEEFKEEDPISNLKFDDPKLNYLKSKEDERTKKFENFKNKKKDLFKPITKEEKEKHNKEKKEKDKFEAI